MSFRVLLMSVNLQAHDMAGKEPLQVNFHICQLSLTVEQLAGPLWSQLWIARP